MDSISQAALGAAVGELVLGKKVGNKALIYGAIGGTIPDLDVFLRPFFNDIDYLGFHRGFSHSIMFALLFAPIMGYYLEKWHPKAGGDWPGWSWLAFWTIVTHPILDSFTVYGTQLFLPFTNYPVALNNIFIIDPVYTLPLTIGVIGTAFFKRENPKRAKFNMIFFAFSHFYMVITLINKLYINQLFMSNYESQGIVVEETFTAPMVANNFFWMSAAVSNDTIYAGTYSYYDNDNIVEFQKIPKNSHLIADSHDSQAIKKLEWFSRGISIVYEKNDSLFWADLRFGRSDQFIEEDGGFTFNYLLNQDEQGKIIGFERYRFGDFSRINFDMIWRRMFNENSKY